MVDASTDRFSAAAQGLGYIYQARFALLHVLQLPEDTAVLLEKDDDVDFIDHGGGKSLASLKHKAPGDRLTDLSMDFWKSVNIWLVRYKNSGRAASAMQFFLFTTAEVAADSVLIRLLPKNSGLSDPAETLSELFEQTLSKSESKSIKPIAAAFNELSGLEKCDFLKRICIFDEGPRIDDVPSLIIDKHMRTIRPEHRLPVFERLEGWWTNTVIELLTGRRDDPILGSEVSDRLSKFAEEYRADNLPISFENAMPANEIDSATDERPFVVQLRNIGLSHNRIGKAILDYYRAFEQRSVWVRENLLVGDELEKYEDRLADEWDRYKDIAFEDLQDNSADDALRSAGKALYTWAESEAVNYGFLRIRTQVAAPYILRGSYHILANAQPEPRVYWHPRFLERLRLPLGGTP